MRRRGPPFRFFSTREKSETKGEPTRARRAPRDDVARNAPPFFGGDERLFDSSARDARPRIPIRVQSPFASDDASGVAWEEERKGREGASDVDAFFRATLFRTPL